MVSVRKIVAFLIILISCCPNVATLIFIAREPDADKTIETKSDF